MSELLSSLHAAPPPLATVTALGPVGMVTLRGTLEDPAFAKAVTAASGLAVPDVRRIETHGLRALAWMSPDELLLICGHEEVAELVAALQAGFGAQHALAVDVSDARAAFEIDGPSAREVLAKLCPVDLAPGVFGPGELRRTRLAQVAAAFWMTGETSFRLVCFRSVATYVADLLELSARAGSDVGYF